MDKCAKYQEMISALLDDELCADEREALHAHMAECPDCRRVYEAFAAIAGAEELEEAPEGMLSGAMFKIRNPAPKKQKHPLWKRYAAAAACLVLVLFGATQLDLRMGANSAAPADCASSAVEVYAMDNADSKMTYVADSAIAEDSMIADAATPADTALPEAPQMPVPMPGEKPAENNAAGAVREGMQQLSILDAAGGEIFATADADALQMLVPMLTDSGAGYSVTVEYADGTLAQFILPVTEGELDVLLKNLG